MDHFLHHNHRSSRYASLSPPHQPPNHHHLRNHALMVSDFHPLHPQPPPRVYTLFPPYPQTHNPNSDSVPASTFHRLRDSDIQSNFDGYYERHEIVEKASNRFVKHWKKRPRVLPRFELGNSDIGDDGNSRGKKEHTPQEQVQRKSAFLTMRKPNQWIREIEQTDSNKDHQENLGDAVKAEKREGSIVELDISFESNAMVAKAIVPSSSSLGVSKIVADRVSGTNLTPTGESKALSVISDSQVTKQSSVAVSSNSLQCKASATPGAGKDVILRKNVSDACSQQCLGSADNLHGENNMAQSSKGVVSGEWNSLVIKADDQPLSVSVSFDSKLAILSTGDVSSNSLLCKVSGSSGSSKDANSQKNVSDTCSQPCVGGAYNPHPRGKHEMAKSSKGIVSDESNSLVAKAGVPPPSSVIVSDTNLISKRQRKKMRRQASISNSACPGSQLAILPIGFVSSNSSLCKAIDDPSSDKDVILAKNVSDTCSQPCLGVAHNPRGKNELVKSPQGIVSDKSNSLVAMAGVPPTTSVIVSDTNLMSKRQRKKIRKKLRKHALISNSAYSDSQLAILSTRFASSNSSLCKEIDNPSSGKDVIAVNNVSVTCSQPCLGVAQNPRAKNEVENSSKGGVLDGSNSLEANAVVPPLSSIILNTDKTVVSDTNLAPTINRKKPLISDSVCSVSQLANISTGAVISSSLPCKASQTSSSGKDVILSKNVSDACSQPCLTDAHNPHGKNEVGHSSEGIVSDEIANVGSGKTSVRVVKKRRIVKRVVRRLVKPKSIVPCLVLANTLDGTVKVDGVTLSSPTHSASGKTETSLSKKSVTFENVSRNGIISSEINHLDDFNKQLCQGEVFPSTVKYLNVMNEMNSASDGVSGSSLNNLKAKSEENFTVCDIGNDSFAGKLYCENEGPTLSQDVIFKENPDIAITVPSSGMVDFSSLSKTSTKEGSDFVHHVSCSNPYCKLTHKVIPERMPDCSYFLQGLCANTNCSYRHVNVNPKASICEGFLKGYCAEGNECRKKHSDVYPTFEATENCNQGTRCKKQKTSGYHNNGIGSIPIDFSEPGMMVGQRQHQHNNENEGEIAADYISVEVDEGVAESADESYEEATLCGNNNPFDLELDNLDELIKPVLIMNRNFMAQSSPVPVM